MSYGVTREGTLAGQWSTVLSVAIVLTGAGALVRWSREQGSPAGIPHFSDIDSWPDLRSRILTAVVLVFAYSRVPFNVPLQGAATVVLRSLVIAGAIVELRQSNGFSHRSWRAYWLRLLVVLIGMYSVFAAGFASYAFLLVGPLLIMWVAQMGRHPRGAMRWNGILAVLMVITPLAAGIWLTARGAVRSAVWEQDAALQDGLLAATEVDLSSVASEDSEAPEGLLVRFNHAHWLHRVEANHRLHPELRGADSKLPYLVVAWLPRFLWPGKPSRTGGGDFLGLHADHVFSKSATFGYGVMVDAFVYGGWLGVVILMGALGGLLGYGDRVIIRASLSQDWAKQWLVWAAFVPWFDPLVDFFDGASAALISAGVAFLAVRLRR